MLPKYERHKETPALWIDAIPNEWQSKKIREIFIERRVKVSDKDYEPLSVSKAGIVPQLSTAVKTDNGDNRKLVKAGDFVINSRSDRKGSSGISPYDGSVSLINIVLKPITNENPKFLHYMLRSSPFAEEYYRNGRGLVSDLWTTRYDELKNIFVPIPPRPEQDQIVRFLDWKTSEIARFIHEKKRQIKRLRELRASIINNAVTHGINPSVRLKESGHAWIDNIPEHWDMLYSKKLFALRKDKAFSSDEQLTSSQKYGIISQSEYMKIENRRLTVVMTGADILKHVEAGDFVISMRSFQGGIEYSKVSGKISSAYVMLIPNSELVYDRYFKWLLKSPSYIKALQGTSDLVRDGQALRYANFAKVYLPKVPLNEQEAIADYLDTMSIKIDDMIEAIRLEISYVVELRTKTIADVAIGKVDVRNVEIPEYESEADDSPAEDETDEDSENEENIDEEVDD